MFDPVRLFWTTLEVVLESLCEGGAQGSNFYKWTTLQDTAIRNKHQSIFMPLYILLIYYLSGSADSDLECDFAHFF